MINLKPCPFCGSPATWNKYYSGGTVECTNKDCKVKTPYCPNEYNAVYRWNRRVLG